MMANHLGFVARRILQLALPMAAWFPHNRRLHAHELLGGLQHCCPITSRKLRADLDSPVLRKDLAPATAGIRKMWSGSMVFTLGNCANPQPLCNECPFQAHISNERVVRQRDPEIGFRLHNLARLTCHFDLLCVPNAH
jgi:hypothetical protein